MSRLKGTGRKGRMGGMLGGGGSRMSARFRKGPDLSRGTVAPPTISPIRPHLTIAPSFRTVFQLRPVPGVPNFFSISLAVSLDCPTPAG
jgi:hypothetical protein